MSPDFSERRYGDPPAYHLTEQEGLDAMHLFLRQFMKRAGNDLATMIGDTTVDAHDTFDPAAWTDWLECVSQVVARRKSEPPSVP